MWVWCNRLHTAVERDAEGTPLRFCRTSFLALAREQGWCHSAFWPLLSELEQGLYAPLPADDGEGLNHGD